MPPAGDNGWQSVGAVKVLAVAAWDGEEKRRNAIRAWSAKIEVEKCIMKIRAKERLEIEREWADLYKAELVPALVPLSDGEKQTDRGLPTIFIFIEDTYIDLYLPEPIIVCTQVCFNWCRYPL